MIKKYLVLFLMICMSFFSIKAEKLLVENETDYTIKITQNNVFGCKEIAFILQSGNECDITIEKTQKIVASIFPEEILIRTKIISENTSCSFFIPSNLDALAQYVLIISQGEDNGKLKREFIQKIDQSYSFRLLNSLDALISPSSVMIEDHEGRKLELEISEFQKLDLANLEQVLRMKFQEIVKVDDSMTATFSPLALLRNFISSSKTKLD